MSTIKNIIAIVIYYIFLKNAIIF